MNHKDRSAIRPGCSERESAKKRFSNFRLEFQRVFFRIETMLN